MKRNKTVKHNTENETSTGTYLRTRKSSTIYTNYTEMIAGKKTTGTMTIDYHRKSMES
jgi:hypothetical protein